jgi:hypothetical protein
VYLVARIAQLTHERNASPPSLQAGGMETVAWSGVAQRTRHVLEQQNQALERRTEKG